MFTIDELLSKRNQRDVFAYFAKKADSRDNKGIAFSEFQKQWPGSYEAELALIKSGTYQPGIITCTEIVKSNGSHRVISKMDNLDRFITRLLAQTLNRYFNPLFLPALPTRKTKAHRTLFSKS